MSSLVAAAVGVGVHHHLGAAAERVVAHRVHVADDHVRLVAGLTQRVGAAVDPDEHRPVVADVGAEGVQVLLVVVAADDDQHVPALDLRRDVGDAHAVQQERALPLHVLHGVGGEGLELGREAGLRLRHGLGDRGAVVHGALGDDIAVVGEEPVAVEPQVCALLAAGEHVLADVVEQRDAGGDEDLGAEVGIAAGDAGRGVDHRGDLAVDQRVRAHPVDVDVVDHGDVTGLQPLGQVLRAAVQPDGAGDSGPGVQCPAAPKGADAHGSMLSRCPDGQLVRRASAI
jgi:hypothetical protein